MIWMDVDVALAEVPVNFVPLVDDTDFKTREESVTFNQAGMDLVWNFVTTAGAMTQTAVTPTTAGPHDWVNQGNGIYSIEIPASSGTINNDTEGFGWFTGFATGVLPWTGPIIGFRAAGANNALIDAWSATRGAAGTALPAAVADAAGGLPISDAGGLDLDAITLAGPTRIEATTDKDAIISQGDAAWTTGVGGTGLTALASGTAQAGAAAQITLASGEPATDNLYRYARCVITGGTGAGQSRFVTGYTGSSKIATTIPDWEVDPDDTSTYELQGADASAILADAAHGGTAALLTLERMVIASTTTDEPAVELIGDGAGAGLKCQSAGSGDGINATGGTSNGSGFSASARGGNKPGMTLTGDGAGAGIEGSGGATGRGARFIGGATSGVGMQVRGQGGNAIGFELVGAGSGKDIDAAEIDAIKTDTGNLVSRITSALFTGITSMAEWLGLMAGAQTADATALAEIKLTGAGSGAYDEAADSQEAIAGAGSGGAPTADQNAAAVWDRILTGATHNINNSAGKRLRQLGDSFGVHSGTAQAGSTTTIQLDTGASAVDGIYNGDRIIITDGTGVQEHGVVIGYVGATKTATMARAWVIPPDNTSEFLVVAAGVNVEAWAGAAVTGDGDWAELQGAMDDVTKVGPTRIEATADRDTVLTRLGAPAGVSVSADIAANQVDLNSILARLLTMQVEKNAAFSNFEFLMVLASDGRTPATGLTVTGQRSIDGGAFANVTGTITEVSNGIYQFDAVAADTSGDRITWRFSSGTADDTFVTFNTVI